MTSLTLSWTQIRQISKFNTKLKKNTLRQFAFTKVIVYTPISWKARIPFTKYFHTWCSKFSPLNKLSITQILTSAFHRKFEIKERILVAVNRHLLHYVRDVVHPIREIPWTLQQCHRHDHQTCSDKEWTYKILGRQWQYLYAFKALTRV